MERNFNKEWENGNWDYMGDISQCFRYGATASVINHLKLGNILDVGCGEGTLVDYIKDVSRYEGLDISKEAIRRAKQKHPECKFSVNTVQDFATDGRFDIVVFDAILYAVSNPEEMIIKYSNFLKKDGHILITHFGMDTRELKFDDYSLFRYMDSVFDLVVSSTSINWQVSKFPVRHIRLYK